MPFALSSRIAFLFCVTFLVALSSAFAFTYFQLSYSLEQSSKEVLSLKLHEMSSVLTHKGVSGLKELLSAERHRMANAHFLIRVTNDRGQTLFLKRSMQDDDGDSFDRLIKSVPPGYSLEVARSSEERENVSSHILSGFVLMGGFLALAGMVLGIWYARRSLAPIRTLLATIQGIESGDLSQRVPLGSSKDELRDLGATFNRMIARIETLVLMMRESLDNVAHDIRTPLTRVRAVAEDALLSGNESSLKGALEECAEDATAISELVDQLMSISEAEAGTLPIHYEICGVKELLEEVAEVYEFVAQEKEIQILISPVRGELSWELDRKRIKQVIGNLLDNAIKFSPRGSDVLVLAVVEQNRMKISVKDQGPGIPDAELPRIWDRLFRGDKSRSTKGTGIGLSIVRSTVLAHGGQVEARQGTEGGMVFTVAIPHRSNFPATSLQSSSARI
jgi:signal transduction histidine kinase